jgi:transposase
MPEYTVDRVSSTPPETCPKCGVVDTPQLGPGAGPHVARWLCRHCGTFLRWASRFPPSERTTRRDAARLQAMARRAPSRAQLKYLAELGDSGPVPVNMAEASHRINALVHGEVRA